MKINYKCSSVLKEWGYICEDCRDISMLIHKASDDMHCHKCEKCGGDLLRYISKAPSLDADYHQDHLTRNIGWARK